MTAEQKAERVNGVISEIGLKEQGYFATVEGDHIWVGSEDHDDGTAYPLTTSIGELLADVHSLPKYL